MKNVRKRGTDRMRQLGKRQLVVWMDDADREIIDSLASAAGMPTARYVRESLIRVHSAGITFAELGMMRGGKYHVTGRK